MDTTATAPLRIGQLAERVGVSTDVLRVWERRYGLFDPARSPGRYRLYAGEDERRARRVLALRSAGVPVGEAVAQVLRSVPRSAGRGAEGPAVAALVERLDAGVRAFDAAAVVAAFDEAVDRLGVLDALCSVVMPYLVRLGEQWEIGEVGVAHEHFASHVLRRGIGELGVEQPPTEGRTVVLACPPGERHDIVLLAVGVLLSDAGWCVRFLGADTPIPAVLKACLSLDPTAVVISASRRTTIEAHQSLLRRLGNRWPLAVGGRGAHADLAALLGATRLSDDLAEVVPAMEELALRPAPAAS